MLVLDPTSRCDVCLDGYTDGPSGTGAPHAIPCGHVFCRTCLESIFPHSCPLCRKAFAADRIKKLHVDRPSAMGPVRDEEETELLERLSLGWGMESTPDELEEIEGEVRGWLEGRLPNASLPLRRAFDGLAQFRELQDRLRAKSEQVEILTRDAHNTLATHQQEKATAQGVEESLLKRVAEMDSRSELYQAQITSLEEQVASLQRPRRTHNPLPAPPILVEYTPAPTTTHPSTNHPRPWIPWETTNTPSPPSTTTPPTRRRSSSTAPRIPYPIYRSTTEDVLPGPDMGRWVVPATTANTTTARSETPPPPPPLQDDKKLKRAQHVRRQSEGAGVLQQSHITNSSSSSHHHHHGSDHDAKGKGKAVEDAVRYPTFPPQVAQLIRNAVSSGAARPPTVPAPPLIRPSAVVEGGRSVRRESMPATANPTRTTRVYQQPQPQPQQLQTNAYASTSRVQQSQSQSQSSQQRQHASTLPVPNHPSSSTTTPRPHANRRATAPITPYPQHDHATTTERGRLAAILGTASSTSSFSSSTSSSLSSSAHQTHQNNQNNRNDRNDRNEQTQTQTQTQRREIYTNPPALASSSSWGTPATRTTNSSAEEVFAGLRGFGAPRGPSSSSSASRPPPPHSNRSGNESMGFGVVVQGHGDGDGYGEETPRGANANGVLEREAGSAERRGLRRSAGAPSGRGYLYADVYAPPPTSTSTGPVPVPSTAPAHTTTSFPPHQRRRPAPLPRSSSISSTSSSSFHTAESTTPRTMTTTPRAMTMTNALGLSDLREEERELEVAAPTPIVSTRRFLSDFSREYS